MRPIASRAELRKLVEAAETEAELDFARVYEVQRGHETERELTLQERTSGLRSLVAVLAMLEADSRGESHDLSHDLHSTVSEGAPRFSGYFPTLVTRRRGPSSSC